MQWHRGMPLAPLLAVVAVFWLPVAAWLIKYGGWPSSLMHYAPARVFVNNFVFASLATCASMVIAFPLALSGWHLSRRSRTATAVLTGLVAWPLVVGLLARNYSWIALLQLAEGPAGYAGVQTGLIALVMPGLYTKTAVLVVLTYVFVPIAYICLLQGLMWIPAVQIESATLLGAGKWQLLRRILLPLSTRSAGLAALLIFFSAAGYFVTPAMIGGGKYDMLGNIVLSYVGLGDFRAASAVSVGLLIALVPLYFVAAWLIVLLRRRLIGG